MICKHSLDADLTILGFTGDELKQGALIYLEDIKTWVIFCLLMLMKTRK